MKKIVYTKPDGSLVVVHPVINSNENLTEGQAVQRALVQLPAGVSPVVVEETALPADRSKRAAWSLSGSTVVVDDVRWTQMRDQLAASFIDAVDRTQFRLLFRHENALRALQGQPQVTAAQFRQFLIDDWKANNP